MGGSIFSSEVSLTCPQSFILRLVREKSLSISKRLSSTEFGLPNIVLFHTLSLFLCLCLFPLSNSSTQEHTRTHTHTLYWDPNESQIMCLLRNFSIFFYSTEFFYFYFDFLSPPQKKIYFCHGNFPLSRFYKLYYCSVHYQHTPNISGSTINEHKNNKIF
jgi:hypothetical protein